MEVLTPPATAPVHQLARAAASGVAVQGSSYLIGKLTVLFTTVVLARVLEPADFGLVAFALVFIGYVDVIRDFGVAQALVYLPVERRRSDAALTCAVGSGLLLAGGLCLAAPFLAGLLHRADATPLIRVMSVTLVIGAVSSVPESLLRRELRFGRTLVAGLARAGAIAAASVPLALAGFGPWALVWGQVAGALCYNVCLWPMVDYRPGRDVWRPRWATSKSLLRYGGAAAAAMLMAKLIFDIDYLIVGSRLGAEQLGFYALAFRLPEMAIINVFFVVSAVAFPVYSRVKGDRVRLGRGYLMSVRMQSVFGGLAGATMAVASPLLVAVLFGSEWHAAIAPLTALAAYAALRSLGVGANDVYKSIGKPGLAVSLAVVRLIVLAPMLLLATRWGITGVAWMQVAVAAVFVVLSQWVAARVLGVGVGRMAKAMVPAVAAAGGAVAFGLVVRSSVHARPAVLLALVMLASIVGGLLALRLATPAVFRDTRVLLRSTARAHA